MVVVCFWNRWEVESRSWERFCTKTVSNSKGQNVWNDPIVNDQNQKNEFEWLTHRFYSHHHNLSLNWPPLRLFWRSFDHEWCFHQFCKIFLPLVVKWAKSLKNGIRMIYKLRTDFTRTTKIYHLTDFRFDFFDALFTMNDAFTNIARFFVRFVWNEQNP